MKDELLQILQHSLGVDEYGRGDQYRNHFVAGGDDLRKCRELVDLGYMKEYDSSVISGGSPWFNVTKEGIEAMVSNSPAPPKDTRTRGQKRYQAYLRSESDESFGDWLKNKYWDDHRKEYGA